MLYTVLPIGRFNTSYTYSSEEKIKPGTIVEISIKSRKTLGIVCKNIDNYDGDNLKEISRIYSYCLNYKLLKLIEWMAWYTISCQGNILKMFLGEMSVFQAKRSIKTLDQQLFSFKEITLSGEQMNALEIIERTDKNVTLLHGVTGSGKTEVYLKYVQNVLATGKQALILLPEIALTTQMIDRIEKYIGTKPLIWNSSISKKMRKQIWTHVYSEKTCLVIGTRSALFLPFNNLGVIIVDEEHDQSYKQNDMVLYNARDMAVVFGNMLDIKIILSSATPSIETYINAVNSRYSYAKLESRFSNISMPKITLIDMRNSGNRMLISHELKMAIENVLANGEQVMLFLNKRGFAPIVLCKSCGHKISCPNCSSFLVMHKKSEFLCCHICGYKKQFKNNCCQCKSNEMITFGAGVEKLYDEVKTLFPQYNTIIASSDTMDTAEKIDSVLDRIKSGDSKIIISTQILAKGHHFKNLSTVCIVDGDCGLDQADIRALEKNYQLLYQVFGRAGREQNNGKVFIQTFELAHPIYNTLKNYDQIGFYSDEIELRKKYLNPPFSRMVAIIISGRNEKKVEIVAKEIAKIKVGSAILLGPVPAPILKIRGKTRWRILIKAQKNLNIQNIITEALQQIKIPNDVGIQIDVDPIVFV